MSIIHINMYVTKIKTHRRFINLIGQKFGNLKVINGPLDISEESEWKKKQRKWLCQCKCGKEVVRVTSQLNKGAATSCGCDSKERLVKLNTQNCRPFEWIYNNLLRCAKQRKHEVTLSFDDFLEFIKIHNCCYCNDIIKWIARNSKSNPISNSYYIDRKNNKQGYTKENCVVCCGLCNFTKHSWFTYDEMLLLGKTIQNIKQKRLGLTIPSEAQSMNQFCATPPTVGAINVTPA